MNNVTEALVQRVFSIPKLDELAPMTKENLKKGMLDYIVCCHAAVLYDKHFTKIWNSKIFPEQTDGAYVFGTGKRTHPYDACLINGYAAHALDLDDVHSGIRGHPSAVILSVLFSLVSRKKAAASFYEAYLAGVEVMTRIAKLLGKNHYEKGFHTTATAGLYGAVAAGAYYLDFSSHAFQKAIDLCVSQLSGSRSHFGTLIKPLHVGLTAQKAWQILQLVENGISGSSNTIVSRNGLLAMYGSDQADIDFLLQDWGNSWAIDNPGLWFKLYPCCSANAHPIDATKEIIYNYKVDVRKIASIRLYFPENGDAALVYTFPQNGEEGRFSAEYCVALLLLGKDLSIEDFSVDFVSDEMKELMAKIERVYDAKIKADAESDPPGRYCIVEIKMDGGEILKARCDVPRGSPGNPLALTDLMGKAENLLNRRFDIFTEKDIVTVDDLLKFG